MLAASPRGAIVAAMLCLAVPASAELSDDDTLARRCFELGQTLYARADYEGAIKQFSEAYRLSRRPALLFNIARTRENLGQHEEAITVYQQYLRTRPADAIEVEARLANLRQLVERKRSEEAQLRLKLAPSSEPPPPPRYGGKWLAWSLAGAGAVALVTGGALAGLAKASESQVEDDTRKGLEYTTVIKPKEDRGRALGIAGPVLLGVGGAALVSGVTLLILQHRAAAQERRSVRVTPLIGRGFAALSIEAAF